MVCCFVEKMSEQRNAAVKRLDVTQGTKETSSRVTLG